MYLKCFVYGICRHVARLVAACLREKRVVKPDTRSALLACLATFSRQVSGTNPGTGTVYNPTALPTVGPYALPVPGRRRSSRRPARPCSVG